MPQKTSHADEGLRGQPNKQCGSRANCKSGVSKTQQELVRIVFGILVVEVVVRANLYEGSC